MIDIKKDCMKCNRPTRLQDLFGSECVDCMVELSMDSLSRFAGYDINQTVPVTEPNKPLQDMGGRVFDEQDQIV